MRTTFLLGRMLFGGFFVYNAVHHFAQHKEMSEYAGSKGTPVPETAVLGTGALLMSGGLGIITGVKPREALAAVITFLLPVTLQMHRFWEETDPARRQSEAINFSKNMALIGAALMLLQVPEPWPVPLEGLHHRFARALTHGTYPHPTELDILALPA